MHKPDEWFTQEVIADGDHIIIKVNDETVVDTHDTKYAKGYLAIQQHNEGSVVHVRKAEIKELPASKAEERVRADSDARDEASRMLKPACFAADGSSYASGMAAFLEVADLIKQYGAVKALNGVSFSVGEGELFGLLGPNGAGKTTLLSILSCLLEPTSGEVFLQGRRVRQGDQWVRRLIGVVPQELALYGDLTARENLHFFGELYGLGGAELRERVKSVLAAVALEDKADDRVTTFSGGMKRRLNLGAALVHQPRLLLLDEPTVGVDPQSRNHIFEEVRRLNATGVTILYTSHYMEEVQALCPRVGIMDHGRLVACGEAVGTAASPERPHPYQHTARDASVCASGCRSCRNARCPSRTDTAAVELNCRDVKATLVRLVAILNELQVELVSLETEEPNLERVFLHLTGRELRD